MKITILGPAYPYRGGIASFNERLAKELFLQGHTVTVETFSMQYPSFLFPGKTQYCTEKANFPYSIHRSIHSLNPFNWYRVGRQLRKERADCIIIAYWMPFMAPCFGTIARLVKKNKHTSIMALVHNMIPHEGHFYDTVLSKYFVNTVDSFMTLSESVQNDVKQLVNGKPVNLSPHPLYDHFGDIVDKKLAKINLNLDTEYNYLLFFGIIREYKGLDLLLKSLALLDLDALRLKLIVAGEFYTDEKPYTNLINSLGLKDKIIQINHFIPDSEVRNYFCACDLVVQPYKSGTQSGVTQIAYHFNKPMIVTRVGGIPEMVPDGRVGYVTDIDPSSIAQAIGKFYEESKEEVFVEQVKEEKKRFSWSLFVDQLMKIV